MSSPRLKFSEAQVEAILRWAKALKAEDVPSKYALEKSQRELATILGNPTKKVTGTNGNVFYINDIAHAIAKVSICIITKVKLPHFVSTKDYSNPLTRFAMSDFPELDGKGASQAFHGHKMLLDSPQGIATPCAKVRGKVYFVNELLQCVNGSFFIPERFYMGVRPKSSRAGTTCETPPEKELLALGRIVERTEVRDRYPNIYGSLHIMQRGFHVNSEKQVICPTSSFEVPYDKLPSSDLSRGFEGIITIL